MLGPVVSGPNAQIDRAASRSQSYLVWKNSPSLFLGQVICTTSFSMSSASPFSSGSAIIVILFLHQQTVQWQKNVYRNFCLSGSGGKCPLNFGPSKICWKIFFIWKLSSKSAKSEAENPPLRGNVRAKLKFWASCPKLSAACQNSVRNLQCLHGKTCNFRPHLLFFNYDAANQHQV